MTHFTTTTSKGQVTLSADFRKQLGIKPGIKLATVINERGNIEIIRPVSLGEVRRQNQEFMRKNKVGPITDDQITQASKEAAVARYRRSLV